MEISSIFTNWDASTTLVLFITFLCTYWLSQTFSKRSYPPGPFAWPVIGHLPKLMMGKSRTTFFDEVAKEYGPVTTVWLGPQPAILLNSQEAIREAFVDNADEFDNRPFPAVLQMVMGGKPVGVIINNGEAHRAMRRESLMALHDFGLGNQSLEEKIQEEACALSDELQKNGGQPISNIKRTILLAISNVIISICFGNRLTYGDKEFLELMSHFDTIFQTNFAFQPTNVFPFLARFYVDRPTRQMVAAQNAFNSYTRKQIEIHRPTFDPDNVRDMVDLYLKAEAKNDKYLNADNFFRLIIDLFIAGSETTATTLSWVLLFMVSEPEIQEKAQQEIFKVLGKHKMPAAKDRDKLVYIDAIVHEVLRYASIAPLGIPRYLLEDAQVRGTRIPKGCYIFPNIYRVHMDKGYWKDPEVFRPERWIDEAGRLIKHEHYMPFSIGKRNCLGESFAKIEAFIVVTILLQRFRFSLPDGSPKPSLEGVFGITRAPLPFELCAVPLG